MAVRSLVVRLAKMREHLVAGKFLPVQKNRFRHPHEGSGSLRVWSNRLLAIT